MKSIPDNISDSIMTGETTVLLQKYDNAWLARNRLLPAHANGRKSRCGGRLLRISPLALATSSLVFMTASAGAVDYTSQIIADGTTVTLSAGDTVTTSNGGDAGSSALIAKNPNGLIVAPDVTVVTSGNSASGAYATLSGRVNIAGGSYSTSGANAHSVAATSNGIMDLSDSSRTLLVSTGTNAAGVYARDGGIVMLRGDDIQSSASGILADGGGMVTMTGGSINGATFGATAQRGNNLITLNEVNITSNGVGAQVQTGTNTIVINGGSILAATRGVYANGVNSLIDLSDSSTTSITVNNNNSYGAWALGGGTVRLNGDTVATTGNNSHGLFANGNGSQIEATNTGVTTSGNGSYGMLARAAGFVSGNNATISTGGTSAHGARAEAGSTIELTSSTIRTTGQGAYGINAGGIGSTPETAAKLIVNASNISTTGAPTAAGDGAHGAVAEDSGTLFINGASTISTTGTKATGLLSRTVGASGKTPSLLSVNGGSGYSAKVTTQGDGAHAAQSCSTIGTLQSCGASLGADVAGQGSGATLNIAHASLSTQGDTAFGLYAYGQGATLAANSTQVTTSGAASHAAVVRNGGSLAVNGSTLSTTGIDAAGLFMTNPAGVIGNALINGSSLSTVQAPSLVVDSGSAHIDFIDSTAVDNNGLWLHVAATDPANPAFAELSIRSSQIAGAAITDQGSTGNVTLADGSLWTVTGNSNLSRLTNNDSLIQFSAPSGDPALASSYKTLTAVNYVGNNGVIRLNTWLGDDSSPSDLLVIDGGNASGTTTLDIVRAGGDGALTTSDGIRVVDAINDATTAPGSFVLANRVVEGVYEYLLHRGGQIDPNDNDWYLRSEMPLSPPEPPEPPIDPSEPEVPVYRPEVAAYQGNQYAAAGMFEHTLHDRLGEPNYAQRARSDGDRTKAGWMRMQGWQLNSKAGQDQLRLDTDSWVVQAGAEIGRWDEGDSRFHMGLMLATGRSTSRSGSYLTGYHALGRVTGYGAGAYATWYADAEQPTGLYVDTWVNYGRYKNEVEGETLARESYRSRTLSASVESGYTWEVRRSERSASFIEPQVQVIFTDYQGGNNTEVNGTEVRSLAAGGLTTRLGGRFYGHTTNAEHNRVQPFVEVNWWHSQRSNQLSFNDQMVNQALPRDRYEVKVGSELELGNGWTGWGHMGYQHGNQDYRRWAGLVGIKRTW